jgi:hypothetical protein
MKSYTLNRIRSNRNLRRLITDNIIRKAIVKGNLKPSPETMAELIEGMSLGVWNKSAITNDLISKTWAKWNTYKTFPSDHIRSKK